MQAASPQSVPAPPGSAAGRNAVFGVFALSGFIFATWVSRIPAVRDDLGLSTSTVGILLFGLASGSIAGLAGAPALLSRLGSRRALLGALLGTGAGAAALGAAAGVVASIPLTLAVLVLFGFVFSALDVLMNVAGAEVEKRADRTLLPLMHAFFSAGTIVGAVLGSAAAYGGAPVGWHFLLAGLLVAGIGACTVRFLPAAASRPVRRRARGSAGPRLYEWLVQTLRPARDLRLVLLGVLVAAMAFAEGSANDWITLAAVDGHGFKEAAGALVYGAFVTAMTAGRVAGGPLLDRYGRQPVLISMMGLGLAGLLLFIITDTPWVAYAAAALWGLGGSLGFPVGISAAAEHPDPQFAARRVSMVSIFGYSAFLVGPPLLGMLGDWWGLLSALYIVVAVLAVALAVTPAAIRGQAADGGRRGAGNSPTPQGRA
ncbi:MFS transporter [Zafaria cholistanensis]|uniref:MFS transporter n=1 Tax=Zafaria cholistanensis TaxID=1682741 RepID=A0A5A7NM26_9MICC|nr:MFS transporter [Zafaria cholistanensis]GER22004.1 MFS transporter [Zafaria cholistanensis]